jgi:hypothetical protein
MVIISISKRRLKLLALTVLAVLLVFVGVDRIFASRGAERYKELVKALKQQEIAVSDEILSATSPEPENSGEVQIFDIGKGRIVKKMKTSPAIQNEAEKMVSSITGVYTRIKPFPDNGYIVRLPLNPALLVQNGYISASVDKIYVIFTQKEPPILLILDNNEKPFVYNFSRSTEELIKHLDFKFTY